jgi:hypothetical protein
MNQQRRISVGIVLLGIVWSALFFSLAFIAWTDGQITSSGRYGTSTVTGQGAVMLGFLHCAFALVVWAIIMHSHRYAKQIKLGLLLVWLSAVIGYFFIV